ncbi:PREDICTED: sperm motility kinase 3-like [Dipodomys ordii]|uniref:non-specific serine/threonine protein kinase n=1 Tax=Dipodomys ordii TaxID=10020 RepID=A0A1S3GMN6_DIPOR|nr:PREDICTED: sperm motility kinase 3-like [Dipodomys ordii]
MASPREEKNTVIGQYNIREIIGYGSFGCVKLAHHRLTDTTVAVKVLSKKELRSHDLENEVDIVKSVHHPHIIRLFQVTEDEHCVYLVTELATWGHLWEYINKSPCSRLFEFEAKRLFRQITSAVRYLHENGIVHLDLKADNVLLDTNHNVKVSDFGLSIRVTPGQLVKGVCGALIFRPPEVFLYNMFDGYKVDTWDLGILLYMMTTGKFPFEGNKMIQIENKILEARYTGPLYLSAMGRDLLSKLLTVHFNQRPAIKKIMQHPWLALGVGFGLLPDEPLPSKLDPIIVTVVCDMGYSVVGIEKAIQGREFNEAMGTYLLMQEHFKENASSVEPKTMPLPNPPCPTPEDNPTSPLPARKNATFSAPSNAFSLPSEFQFPLKRTRSASLPVLLLYTLQSSSSSFIWGPDSFSWSGTLDSFHSVENALPSGHPQGEAIAPRWNIRQGWRRVANRIVSIRRICCCVKAPE